MFGLFKKKTQENTVKAKNPEERFWNWFLDNKLEIEKFIDSNLEYYSIS